MDNKSLYHGIPLIFSKITSILTRKLSLCVIAVDWSGYPFQEHHVLRASLLCDGHSIPLLSQIVPFKRQNNSLIQNDFLYSLPQSLPPDARGIIVTDARFQNAWFHHITSLGWDFIGRIRNNVQFCLDKAPKTWLKMSDCLECKTPEYMGVGTLVKKTEKSIRCHFYTYKKWTKGRKKKRSKGKTGLTKTDKEQSKSAKEVWLIFSSTDDFRPQEIIKLYSRPMQIEQNFRDEKN